MNLEGERVLKTWHISDGNGKKMMVESNEEPICDRKVMEHKVMSMKAWIHGKWEDHKGLEQTRS